jgi:hypothetical protein
METSKVGGKRQKGLGRDSKRVKKDRQGCKKRQTRRSKTTRKGNKKDRQWGVKRQAIG